MSRLSHTTVVKIASGLAVAALLSLSPAKAQYTGAGAAAPEQQGQNASLAQFRDTLQRYGSIFQHPRYGEVWTPSSGVVPAGWSPYPACHWVYDQQQSAWSYQDPTEWGSIVHHYGRWAYDQQYGWMWVADANYGPGHVYWKNEGGSVSWAALTPDVDGGGPSQGWQSQDQQSFSSGCRQQSAPPAPVAYRPSAPTYAPPTPSYGPRYAAAPPSYAPPAYSPPYYGGSPRPVNIFTPPPIRIVVTPPPFGPGNHCQKFPMSPICKQNPGKQDPGKGTSVFCQHNPMVPMCKPGGGNGGIAAGLCATNPSLPNCKNKPPGPTTKPPVVVGKPPIMTKPPVVKFAGLQHPSFRPNVFRPNVFRPSMHMPRPNVFRPTFRPRPMMQARPHFQPRGFGGGMRFAGHARRR